jgi:hypothetical protein
MEKITITVEVDGVELSPIAMDKGEQSELHPNDFTFFKSTHLFNKEHTKTPYDIVVRLDRPKTKEEEKG